MGSSQQFIDSITSTNNLNMKLFIGLALLSTAMVSALPQGRPRYAPAPVVPVVPAPLAALQVGPAKPYSFAYEVVDPLGGTNFGHRETSDGGVVEGEYRVVLPDGRTQIVRYSASEATGYVAEVSYEGTAIAPVAVPAKLVQEAPRSQQLRASPQQARPQSRPQQSQRLTQGRPQPARQSQRQQGRPRPQRNQNTSANDFKETNNQKTTNFQSYYTNN